MNPKVEAALEYADRRIAAGEASTGWVGGSLVAGLGNARSDVDVFLIRDGPAPPIEQVLAGDIRIDVEFRTPEQVEKLLVALRSTPSDPAEGLDNLPSLARLDDAARLFYGRPVRPDDAGARYVAEARSAEKVLRQSRLMRAGSICSSKSEDVWGAQEAGDGRQMLEISGRFLMESLEAYTAGCGHYYVGVKWGFAKLAGTPHHESLLQRLDGLLFGVGLADAQRVSTDRLVLGQQLLSAAFALGWSEPRAYEWARHLPDEPPPDLLVPDPQWVPLRYGDTVLLEGLDKRTHIDISPAGLLLWALAGALPAPSAMRAFEQLAGVVTPTAPQHDEVDAYLASMVDRGLLSRPGVLADAQTTSSR